MSLASEFAEKYKAATEKLSEAQRGRDALQKPAFVVRSQPNATMAAMPNGPFDRLVAHVTVGGELQLSQYQITASEALGLARWILEVFEGPVRDEWMKELHHLDCAIWRLSKGDCTCGGLKFEKPR